ncbi:hypothetical protein GWI33_007861 [Rhynchophorus ferrugineus]|uniref:Carboxylic ester hydrolase n=1 Tax=Rhynchophorus ferrugineus TaxID=354439 RepID=A0A834IDM7_RHYFE|nr:hypothetical protein GWI33_007861 [Rhynchophorus ferrugineus]
MVSNPTLFFLFLIPCCLANLVVKIHDGEVRGTTFTSPNGRVFYAWRGIPFGQAPVGKLRFMPPVKALPWSGILDASSDRSSCYTIFDVYFPSLFSSSEDCLYINVYSPVNVNDVGFSNLPVLFWIYGGAYTIGSGNFSALDPTPLANEDIIVVTFNYRITALGFLSTQDDVISGNAGIKDQNLALRWTRDNIAFFGGNPNDITIMGESAGSFSVGYHLVSPKSRGLFKGAIMQSGVSASDFFITHDNAITAAYALAKIIDPSITTANTTAELRDVLQTATPLAIVSAHVASGLDYRTVLEPPSEDAFLTHPMLDSIENGDFARVPVIIGHTSEESLTFVNTLENAQALAASSDSDPESLIPAMPLQPWVNKRALGEEIKRFYVGDLSFSENLAEILNWYSDQLFVRSSYKQALVQSSYSPVYFYQLSFYGSPSQGGLLVPGAGKVGHAADLAYLFNTTGMSLQTEADFVTRERMVTLWTNFVKTSNPTPPNSHSDVLKNFHWEPVSANNFQILDIGDDLQMTPTRKVTDLVFWDYIWDTYSYRPYNNY